MWVFHLIQFLVFMLQTLTETSGKLATIVHLQRSNLGLGLYRSMIWAVDSTRQSKHFSAAKTIYQGSCVRTKVVIRSAEATCCSCPSSQLALLLIPHLTIHSQAHTSKDAATVHAFCSARAPLETPGRCLLHPHASRWQPAAHTANHPSARRNAKQSSVIQRCIHLHLRPLAWDEWGGERSVTLLVSTARIHTSSSKSPLFIQPILQPMALN